MEGVRAADEEAREASGAFQVLTDGAVEAQEGSVKFARALVAGRIGTLKVGDRVLPERFHPPRRSSGIKAAISPLSEAVDGGCGPRKGALSEAHTDTLSDNGTYQHCLEAKRAENA